MHTSPLLGWSGSVECFPLFCRHARNDSRWFNSPANTLAARPTHCESMPGGKAARMPTRRDTTVAADVRTEAIAHV
eukprot:868131-Amphidinium_carterae.2